MRSGLCSRTWRQYGPLDRQALGRQFLNGMSLRCPRCGEPLEATPFTRLSAVLPPGAGGYDLECRPCRRFHPRVFHTPESLYLTRIRRLAAAIRRA